MKFTVKAIKKTVLPKSAGGTWTKTEIKTHETGEAIMELGRGHSTWLKENLREGSVITGYIEEKPWTGKDGNLRIAKSINGITPEYVYDLLLKVYPNIEEAPQVPKQTQPVGTPFNANSIEYPEGPNPEDIPW